MSYMTYDINNLWCYGCLENRKDLSYSAPGFKLTQKVIFLPKNLKTKKWKFPLYFQEFSFMNFCRSAGHLNDMGKLWKFGYHAILS